jgi:hypothetical protein
MMIAVATQRLLVLRAAGMLVGRGRIPDTSCGRIPDSKPQSGSAATSGPAGVATALILQSVASTVTIDLTCQLLWPESGAV